METVVDRCLRLKGRWSLHRSLWCLHRSKMLDSQGSWGAHTYHGPWAGGKVCRTLQKCSKSALSSGHGDTPPASKDLEISVGTPTVKEVKDAIRSLKNGKATGIDAIHARCSRLTCKHLLESFPLFQFFSKKLCLESFIEVGPQIISTKNQNRFVEIYISTNQCNLSCSSKNWAQTNIYSKFFSKK